MKIPTKQKPSKPTPKTKPNHKANSKPSHPKTKRSNKNNNLDHRDSYEKNDPHGHE